MMKNNNFKGKIELKTLLDDATLDSIERFIEKNEYSGIHDEMLNDVKAKVFEKTGIKTTGEKETSNKKGKKTPMRRWFYAAACVLLAFAVVLGTKYVNFGNNPLVTSGDTSDEIMSEMENSIDEISDQSQHISQNDSFEIKGINWADESLGTDRIDVFWLVKEILWNGDGTQYAWATVVLNKLMPLGVYERENKSLLYQSIAEIEIISMYTVGNTSVPVNEGDTLQIVVDWIVEDGEVLLSHYKEFGGEEKWIYCVPMMEIGQKYVLSFAEIENKEVLAALEKNYPEVDTRLGSFTAYPMFSVDFSEIKGLKEYKIMPTWAYIYLTVYEWYMEDKVSVESNEAKLYDSIDMGIRVPEKPLNNKSEIG